MKPQVEILERRDTPAPLVALTAAQLASLHDASGASDGVADVGQAVQLPVANGVIHLRAADTGNATDLLAVLRAGVLVDSHAFGDGGGLYASAFAQAEGLPLFDVTLDQSQSGLLPADSAFVADLLALQPGDVLTDADLTAALDVLPATLAPPGEPLQLAVAVEDGWAVHTLTLTHAYGEPAWALAESVFTTNLAEGIWKLAVL